MQGPRAGWAVLANVERTSVHPLAPRQKPHPDRLAYCFGVVIGCDLTPLGSLSPEDPLY